MPSFFSFDESEDGGKADHETGKPFPASGYSLWEYANATWVMKKCHCKEGYESGAPPAEEGKYKGEIKRKACEPSTR